MMVGDGTPHGYHVRRSGDGVRPLNFACQARRRLLISGLSVRVRRGSPPRFGIWIASRSHILLLANGVNSAHSRSQRAPLRLTDAADSPQHNRDPSPFCHYVCRNYASQCRDDLACDRTRSTGEAHRRLRESSRMPRGCSLDAHQGHMLSPGICPCLVLVGYSSRRTAG
jgi:hypothetical protein